MRRPRKERGRKRRNPAITLPGAGKWLQSFIADQTILQAFRGASPLEKMLFSAAAPVILNLMRGTQKGKPLTSLPTGEDHWKTFQPHCPYIVGVACPPDCPQYGKPRLDGCHVCDCLYGPKVASPSVAKAKKP